ncbi:MAG: hypothetical protein KatS3mg104_2746 [Phycisphaerae bacterium]|jgi:sugar phosphate isomerase/epimerase|nr:MAG: hypothetical protein KatS3mg104_2746 [Phycisphaerae bacterium]
MKLCISTLVCPTWTFDQIVKACHTYGVNGIDFRGIADEIDITKLPLFTTRLPETLKVLARHHLKMPCLNLSATLITTEPDRWNDFLGEVQRYAQLAHQSQTRYLRIFGGRVPQDMSRAFAQDLARRHLKQLLRITSGLDVRIAWETHDDWCTSDEMLPVLEHFSPEELGVLWDIEHPFRRGEEPERTAERMKSYICHVHIKDSERIDNRNFPRLLGEGNLPIVPTLKALKSIGYSGWYCLETEKRWHSEAPEPDQSISQFVRFMSTHLSDSD